MPLQKDELERLKVLAENLTDEDMAALVVIHSTKQRYHHGVAPLEMGARIDNYVRLARTEWVSVAGDFTRHRVDPVLPDQA